MDTKYTMNMRLSQLSNLELMMNEDDDDADASIVCPNVSETNSGVQSHGMDIEQFQLPNQPCQSNSLLTQMNPLLSASTGLMHHVLNNSLGWPSEVSMSSNQPYMPQLDGYHALDNIDGVGLLNHPHTNRPLGNETCPIQSQNVQSLLSQPNQIDQNQMDVQMSFQVNQTQLSQDSGQTHGSQRTPAAIRSKRNRDKNKEIMETLKNEKEKAMENEKGLTEDNEKLTAENTKMKAEKMEWEKKKQLLTANMTANAESIRKLVAQYEALSQSKQWMEDLEGFRHSNEQILKQNRGSNNTRVSIKLKPSIFFTCSCMSSLYDNGYMLLLLAILYSSLQFACVDGFYLRSYQSLFCCSNEGKSFLPFNLIFLPVFLSKMFDVSLSFCLISIWLHLLFSFFPYRELSCNWMYTMTKINRKPWKLCVVSQVSILFR